MQVDLQTDMALCSALKAKVFSYFNVVCLNILLGYPTKMLRLRVSTQLEG